MIPFRGAKSLGPEPAFIPFFQTANGRHYILAMHAAKDFPPPSLME